MAKLPMNVVKFAALTNDADSVLVYELFQDYFCHYMDETQKRNIGAYDTSRTLAEKDGKMHTQLLSEVQKLAGVEINEDNARRMAKNPMVTWATFAVVEAMKLENDIVATAAGTVKQVLVSKGQTVSTNQVLVIVG